jgi:hypothetical protein
MNRDGDLVVQLGHQIPRGLCLRLLNRRRVSPSRTSRLLLFVFASCGFCQGTMADVYLDRPAMLSPRAVIVSPFSPFFPSHVVQQSTACAALLRQLTQPE